MRTPPGDVDLRLAPERHIRKMKPQVDTRPFASFGVVEIPEPIRTEP